MDDSRDVLIRAGEATLAAILAVPQQPIGLVLFAHGTGSGRLSSRNQFVAKELNDARIATVLLDLLTPQEEASEERGGMLRFDVRMLATRLESAINWSRAQADTKTLPIGLFGASTGAAAALIAAAQRPDEVRAVVSRGGRPDLAGTALRQVSAPTLLIVGSNDLEVLQLNKDAARELTARPQEAGTAPVVEFIVVPGASHLFGEPGALEQVARAARAFFVRYLSSAARS